MRPRLAASLMLILALGAASGAFAQSAEEAGLIATLSSDAPYLEKTSACHRLKEIGTAACVPALAALLNDNALSHPARQALESMSAPEAADALLTALAAASGVNRAGIIDSLGMRRETRAVPILCLLAEEDDDPTVVTAALTSLGRIGTPHTVAPLRKAAQSSTPAVRNAAIAALLRCIAQLRADGCGEEARKVAADLAMTDLPQQFRIAAHKAAIETADDPLAAAITAIITFNGPARLAALRVLNEIPGDEATAAMADAMQKADASTQIALLLALAQRNDKAALPHVAAAADSPDEHVRLAAINALAELGDASVVAMLAKRAAAAHGAEQDAARRALAAIHDANAGAEMAKLLPNASAAEQIELAKIIAERREPTAAPVLVDLAAGAEEKVAVAALRTLSTVADASSADRVIELVCSTPSDKVRGAAADALVKIGAKNGDPAVLVARMEEIQTRQAPNVRLELLSAMARLNFAAARNALDGAMQAQDLRGGAVRIFTENCGADAIQDVLALARNSQNDNERTLMLRGYWRLVDESSDKAPQQRFDLVQAGLAEARSEESRKSAVAALADIPLKAALEAAQKACEDESVRPEAQLALFKVAGSLLLAERAAAENALHYLAQSAVDESIRAKAAAVFASMSQNGDYVVPWLYSGPYEVAGKQAQELFDVPFAPEQPDANAQWTSMPAAGDPANFWMVDLAGVVNGFNRVVYLKTQVFSAAAREAVLEMGSDDGIKLWVNGQLVHANNAVRGFGPGTDQAKVALKEGWNTFLAKITQSTAGCCMAVKIRPAEGAAPEPLKVEAR